MAKNTEPVADEYIARAGGYGLTDDGWVLIPEAQE